MLILSSNSNKLDLFIKLINIAIFLFIIPINFERLLSQFLDIRNFNYFLIITMLLLRLNTYASNLERKIKVIFLLFGLYFIIEFIFHYINYKEIKNMFYAIWMMLILLSITISATTKKRIIYLYKSILYFIALSTIIGLLISLYGEPFLSVRNKILGLSGNKDEYGFILEKDIGRIFGLSKSTFAFGYQLVIMPISSICMIIYENRLKEKIKWLSILIISCIGVFFNAERSAAIIIIIQFLIIIWVGMKGKKKEALFYTFFIVILSIILIKNFDALVENYLHIKKRIATTETVELKARLYQQIAGIKVLYKCPLGIKDYNDYSDVAFEFKSIRIYHYSGIVPSPHNHFINVGLRAGWPGIIIAVLIIIKIVNLIRRSCLIEEIFKDKFRWIFYGILIAFLATITNSFFHNTGIFFAEPASVITLSLMLSCINLKNKDKKRHGKIAQ